MVTKNHIVPLIGGPLCGQSMTIEGIKLPNDLPMYYDGSFYFYDLIINPLENYTEIYYKYNNDSIEKNFQATVDNSR